MNALTFLRQVTDASIKPHTKGRRLLVEAQAWGTMVGLAGGIASAVLGSLLTASGWMAADAGAKHWLSLTGTVLLCLTIPLIVLGGCCLDWLEKDKTQDRSRVARDDDEDDEL